MAGKGRLCVTPLLCYNAGIDDLVAVAGTARCATTSG